MNRKAFLVFDLFLLLLAIGGAFLSFLLVHHNVQVVRVVSDSMAPTIHRGDTLIFKSEPTKEVIEGKILLLPLADGSGRSYVHRVIDKIANQDSSVSVRTKGDANLLPDDWQLTVTSPSVPVYLATIPTRDIPIIHPNKWALLGAFTFGLLLIIPWVFRQIRKTRFDGN